MHSLRSIIYLSYPSPQFRAILDVTEDKNYDHRCFSGNDINLGGVACRDGRGAGHDDLLDAAAVDDAMMATTMSMLMPC